jgi:hypothetical protein
MEPWMLVAHTAHITAFLPGEFYARGNLFSSQETQTGEPSSSEPYSCMAVLQIAHWKQPT